MKGDRQTFAAVKIVPADMYPVLTSLFRGHVKGVDGCEALPGFQVSHRHIWNAVLLQEHVKVFARLKKLFECYSDDAPIARQVTQQAPVQFQYIAVQKTKGGKLYEFAKARAIGDGV